ncbi:hypothetical protein [Sphingobacterium chungjuense]|uniref:hypothetical protein n=1 Tax=Sphingobacterium chungjuense TaxID=2675553 RepID=UPI0014093BEA|nr:hypothetical protein [Sphingobacterium chungjuense]
MAKKKITYTDKIRNNGATAQGRLSAEDANHIKDVVNSNSEYLHDHNNKQLLDKINQDLSTDSDVLFQRVEAEEIQADNGIINETLKAGAVRTSDISSERFVSGFSGEGYRISKDSNGDYSATFDNLTVRKEMNVYQLTINEIRATNGSVWVSDASEAYEVIASNNEYICKIDSDGGAIATPFRTNDIVRCQKFNGQNVKYYTAIVTKTTNDSFTLRVIEGGSIPEEKDQIVRVGNTSDKNRQGALYLTSSDSGAPFLDVIDGVTSASLAGKTKVRLGKLDGIVDSDLGALSGYGIYAQNGYFKGKFIVQAGSNVFTKNEANTAINTAKNEVISTSATDATTKANEAVNTANQFANDAIKAINVGGRNRYSKTTPVERGNANLTFQRPHADAPNGFHIIGVNGAQSTSNFKLNNVVTENGDWTISGYVRQSQNANLSFQIDANTLGTNGVNVPSSNQWTYFTVTVKVDNYSTTNNYVTFKNFAWAFYYFKDIKIEKGNKATDWTPAPEDVDDALQVVRTETTTRFEVLETEINSKVSESNFNSLNQRVGTAETTITQQANQIEQRATKTEFTTLNNNVNGIAGRVTTAEGSITTQAGQINLRATKTELSTAVTNASTDATNKANTAQSNARTYTDSQIKIVDDKIVLKSDRSVTDGLNSRLQSAEAKITPDQINLAVSGQVDNKISNISIGGRNMVKNSSFIKGGNNWSINGGTIYYQNNENRAHLVLASNGQGIYQMNSGVIAGRTYTFSFETMATFQMGTSFRVGFNSGAVGTASKYVNIPTSSSVWNKLAVTVVATNNNDPIIFYNNAGARNEFYIRNIQMEEGNHATAWSPAPEDIDAEITALSTSINLTNQAITLKADKSVTDSLGTRLSGAEAKITPDQINLTVSGQVDNKISNISIGGKNLLIFGIPWYQGNIGVGTDTGGQYIRNPNFIDVRNTKQLTYTIYGNETIYTADIVEYRIIDNVSSESFIRRQNLSGLSTYVSRIIDLHPQTQCVRLVFYRGDGVTPDYAKLGLKVKLEAGNKATDYSPAPEDVDSQITSLQTSISLTNNAINLRATKVELNTSVNGAISTASNDATNKANTAQSNARTYTDSQISVVNNAISLKSDRSVTDALGTRLSSAEAKITPAEINLTVKSQTQNLIESQAKGRNLLLFSLPWYQGNIFGGSDNGSDYIRNPNWIDVTGFRNLTITRYLDTTAIYTLDLVEYRTADASGASYIRRTNVPGGTNQSSTTIELHSQTNFVRIVFYRGGGVSPSYAAIGRKLKVEAGTTATAYSPAPEDLPSREEVQAGISITPNTVNVFGKAIKLNGMVTADSIDVANLTVRHLRTSTDQDRTTLNEGNDGMLKVRHPNGTVGIEMGLINGSPSMIFYNSQGAKLWEAGQQGIIYVDSTPETSTPVNLFLLQSTSNLNQGDARNVLQGSSNSSGGQPKTPVGTIRYLYNAGNNATSSQNKQYEGYHVGTGATSAWIPNGWYCIGNQFMMKEINAGQNEYSVIVMRIWGGKITETVTINNIIIMTSIS